MKPVYLVGGIIAGLIVAWLIADLWVKHLFQ